MPTEILEQLKTLRAGVAEALKKDPRYLTLMALDKSIAEIGGVLASAGLVSAEAAKAPAPLAFGGETAAPAASAASSAKAGLLGSAGDAEPETVEDGGEDDEEDGEDDEDPEPATAEAAASEDTETAEADDESEDAEEDGGEGESDDEGGDADADPVGTAEAEAGDEAGEDDDESTAPAGLLGAGAGGDSVIPEGRASGYRAMAAKPEAPVYQPGLSVKYAKLPNKVDLRGLMTPVENQGQTSSCVANAVVGAWEYWVKRATRKDTDISRLFVYYNARWRNGTQDKDGGSVIQLAMESLSKFGACAEKSWPFDKRLILKKPGGEAYKEASSNRIHDMARVPLELLAWKQALAEGKPIVFGCALFGSFDECSSRGGVVAMPSPADIGRKAHGAHAMCAVGYNDAEKVFIVRNSWGNAWGDKGYCYMPYDYLLNPKFNFGDCWVFVPRVPLPPPREVWFDDSDPVTNDGKGVDFVIVPYAIVDYLEITIDLFADVVVPYDTYVTEDFATYVGFAERSEWSRFESFDVETYLETTEVTETIEEVTEESEETEETEEETEETEETEEDSEDEDSDEEDSEDDDGGDDEEENSEDDDGGDDEEDDSEDDDGGDDEEDDSEDEGGDDDEEDDSEDDGGDDEEDDSEDDDSGDDEEEDSEDDDGGDDEEDDSEDDDGGDDEEEDSEDEGGDDEEEDSEDEGGDDEEEDSEDDDGGDDEGGDSEDEGGDDEEEDSADDDGGDDEEEDSEDDDSGDDEEEDSEDEDDGGEEEEDDSEDDGGDDEGDDEE